MSRARVVIVDDHQLLAESVALALSALGVETAVFDLPRAASKLTSILALTPDLVLLDLDLGQGIAEGLALVAPLVDGGCRVLVVTAWMDPEAIGAALADGAVGVVDKSAPLEHLIAVATACAQGVYSVPRAEKRRIDDAARRQRTSRERELAPFAMLTLREAEVLRCLIRGENVAGIAGRAHVSEATVRSQVRGILTKLDVASQLSAVALARRVGWSAPSE
ncbi:DNA-binding response regulator [Nocardioides marmorisolisilvae]|uniref:DNA-binding response regulator n=2 Tax=Nocardioides marmorisolisilvae TaxID=1542737 RepID=A0A3N0DX39_9ACTN|nr:DNA-binding response regulator [Nocardioides marmorisolisilvae]